jgi:hypothetical protein
MAPLSHDLAGLVLPHNHFGDHLDNSGNTKDEDQERKNFAHAGKTLAEVWSDTVIDGHPVVAEYVEDVATTDIQSKDASWHSVHVHAVQAVRSFGRKTLTLVDLVDFIYLTLQIT